jgi:hypothetical protein
MALFTLVASVAVGQSLLACRFPPPVGCACSARFWRARTALPPRKNATGHPSVLNSLILRGLDANSWPTTRRAARGMATRSAGFRKSFTRGYGFRVFVPRTPCGRGIETPLMENQGFALSRCPVPFSSRHQPRVNCGRRCAPIPSWGTRHCEQCALLRTRGR